jgi:hypothetical protein
VSGLSTWLYHHDGHVALLQVTVWAVCVGVALGPVVRAWRQAESKLRWGLLGLGLAGALVSLLCFPVARYYALGHEASYFECFQGVSSPSSSHGWEAYVTYPIYRWGYWAVGAVVGRDGGPLPLVLINAVGRGLAIVAFGWFCALLSRRTAPGLVGAGLLVLHPVHAFYGAVIFHTGLPWMLAAGCLLLAVLAWRSGDARLMLAAAASGSLMEAVRVEWGLLAPSLLLLLLLGLGQGWGRSPDVWRWRFWLPGLALAGLIGLTLTGSGGSLTEQGGYHGLSPYLETVGRQVLFLEVFQPWHLPWMAAVVLLGLWSWGRQEGIGWRGPAALVGMVLIGHVGLATFNDYGFRHALLPGAALLAAAAMTGLLLSEGRRLAAVAAATLGLAALTSSWALVEVSSRFFASEETFFERAEGFEGEPIPQEQLEDGSCYLITDNERLWSMGLAGSHFNLMDPGEAVTRYRSHDGCVLWLFDMSQWRWDSLVAHARARKLRYWFEWERTGWVRLEQDGTNAVVYRMAAPPWGVADDEPTPETEFLLEEQ